MTTATKPLSTKQVCELLNITDRTLRNWVRHGVFPRPLPIGRRKKWWNADDVERALSGQMTENGEKAKARRRAEE
jgi:excisionase family DNA binding protein